MFKDEILDRLAEIANVAQFVSFGPDGSQRFCRIAGHAQNHSFAHAHEAVAALLAQSPDKTVNVRSFRPDQPQGNEFIYGIGVISEVLDHIQRLTRTGLHVIVNETIDIDDGGVSGVLQDGCLEFAPGVVPRFVEKHGADPVPALPRKLACTMLETVYGVCPDFGRYCDANYRVEFSIHPGARGYKRERTIIWEEEYLVTDPINPYYVWPNPFSRLLGDKAYGLLLGWLLKAPVPRCTVFPRESRLSPFTFGTPTGSGVRWTRTCPRQQEPGKFSTVRTWVDPYALMEQEDPEHIYLSSCIVQDEVRALYSGALIVNALHQPIIEGVKGFGDAFMLGEQQPEHKIPQHIIDDIHKLYAHLSNQIQDAIRFEWAHDGYQIWLLQLHKGQTESRERIIVPGAMHRWIDFYVSHGLQALQGTILDAQRQNCGIRIVGNVGMSSHIADVLRKARVPSELVSPEESFA